MATHARSLPSRIRVDSGTHSESSKSVFPEHHPEPIRPAMRQAPEDSSFRKLLPSWSMTPVVPPGSDMQAWITATTCFAFEDYTLSSSNRLEC